MIDVTQLQTRLNAHGAALAVDGGLGPRTYAALFAFVGQRDLGDRGIALGEGAVRFLPGAAIGTPLRLAHFLGQTAVESMGFRALRELWGPTPAQSGYEGREDLGNTQPGDGKRFMGRGLIQITGRSNYADVGARLGLDLAGHPELAEDPHVAVETACDYWSAHGLNHWADADDVLSLSRAINCGNPHSTRTPNGYAERQVATARARTVLL